MSPVSDPSIRERVVAGLHHRAAAHARLASVTPWSDVRQYHVGRSAELAHQSRTADVAQRFNVCAACEQSFPRHYAPSSLCLDCYANAMAVPRREIPPRVRRLSDETRRLVDWLAQRPDLIELLTRRQGEIARRLIAGESCAAVARSLGVTPGAVRKSLQRSRVTLLGIGDGSATLAA